MSGFVEALKYFTALFQIKTNYLRYIRAVFLYRLKRKAEFPRAFLNLEGAKFVTRENSMDRGPCWKIFHNFGKKRV